MTIIFAAGGEPYVEGGLNGQKNTADIALPALAGATGVAARSSTWTRRDARYGWEVVCDAAGENGMLIASAASGAGATAGFAVGASCYVCSSLELSTVTPLQPLVIAEISGANGGWFHNWRLHIASNGDWQLLDSGGAVKATWQTPGLLPGTLYRLLFHFEDQSDRIRLWVGADDPLHPGRLANPSDWLDGREKINYQQNHPDSFGGVALGARNYAKNNANTTARFDSIVYSTLRPAQPLLVALATLTGDGYYAGAATQWLKGGGGAAAYTEVDDPVGAAPDGGATYIRCVSAASSVRDDRFSATHETAGAIGLAPDDPIIAVLALANKLRAPGGGALGTAYTFIRYAAVDDDAAQLDAWADAGNYQTAWRAYNAAPGGGAWTPAKFDATEWGVKYENGPLTSIEWRVTWGGIYVAYQKAEPFLPQPPDVASMRPLSGFGEKARPTPAAPAAPRAPTARPARADKG